LEGPKARRAACSSDLPGKQAVQWPPDLASGPDADHVCRSGSDDPNCGSSRKRPVVIRYIADMAIDLR
jgi:hypothetical protein